MPDCSSPIEISQWIPVIGTVIGTLLGAALGIFGSHLSHKNKESAERENRERNRLESLYETLIEIRMEYQGLLGEMISKVHFNIPPKPKEYSRTPPLIKLDMVIHMYFPGLVEAHKKLVSAVVPFGQKWTENISASFSGFSTPEKQKVCGEYTMLLKEIDSEISNLQCRLSEMAKS